jgi:hypothetical protein
MPASLHDLMILTGYSRYEARKLLSSGLLLRCIRCSREVECARFSREHLLEMCFVRAFDGCGVALSDAIRAARIWIAQELRGELTGYFAWRPSRGLYTDGERWTYVFDDRSHAVVAICRHDDRHDEEAAVHAPGAVIVINRGHIVRRVDGLLAGRSTRRYTGGPAEAEPCQYRQAS